MFVAALAGLALVGAMFLVACDDEDADDARSAAEEAAEDAESAADDAVNEAEDAADDAVNEAEDAADDVRDAVEADTADLEEQNDSGIDGEVTIVEDGDQVTVTVEVSDPSAGPVHLYEGSCDDLAASPAAESITEIDGATGATLPVTPDQLDEDDYAVVVHVSDSDPTPAACATI
jgi:hypothetical protein